MTKGMGPAFQVKIPVSELAPPGISGDLHTVFHYEEEPSRGDDSRLRDQEEREFEAHAFLMRDSAFERDIKTEIGPADGTSFFQVPPAFSALSSKTRQASSRSYSMTEGNIRASKLVAERAQRMKQDRSSYARSAPLSITSHISPTRL